MAKKATAVDIITPEERQARINAWTAYRNTLQGRDRAKVGLLLAALMLPNVTDRQDAEAACTYHDVESEKMLERRIGGNQ